MFDKKSGTTFITSCLRSESEGENSEYFQAFHFPGGKCFSTFAAGYKVNEIVEVTFNSLYFLHFELEDLYTMPLCAEIDHYILEVSS